MPKLCYSVFSVSLFSGGSHCLLLTASSISPVQPFIPEFPRSERCPLAVQLVTISTSHETSPRSLMTQSSIKKWHLLLFTEFMYMKNHCYQINFNEFLPSTKFRFASATQETIMLLKINWRAEYTRVFVHWLWPAGKQIDCEILYLTLVFDCQNRKIVTNYPKSTSHKHIKCPPHSYMLLMSRLDRLKQHLIHLTILQGLIPDPCEYSPYFQSHLVHLKIKHKYFIII